MESATAPASDPPTEAASRRGRRPVDAATMIRISEAAAVAAVQAFYGRAPTVSGASAAGSAEPDAA